MSEKIAVKDSTEKAAPAFCDRCRPVKHYDVAVAYVDVELCPTHRAAPSLYAALLGLRMGEGNNTGCWCVESPLRTNQADYKHGQDCLNARAALALVDGKPCYDCKRIRPLREYERDNHAGTDVLHIEICSDCFAERTE